MPFFKIIKTGHIIAVYKYQKVNVYNEHGEETPLDELHKKAKEKDRIEKLKELGLIELTDYGENETKTPKEVIMKKSIQRTKQNIRWLANANFTENDLLVTLTYRENMQDIEKGNADFKKHIQRAKRRFGDFKYLAVMEFQERGAIHYHMMCNIPLQWNQYQELLDLENWYRTELWFDNGWVDIERMNKTKKGNKDVDNVGAYLVSYLGKNFEQYYNIQTGKKKYLKSKNLEQPDIIQGEQALILLDSLEGVMPTFTNEYENEYQGKVEFREYNFKRWK